MLCLHSSLGNQWVPSLINVEVRAAHDEPLLATNQNTLTQSSYKDRSRFKFLQSKMALAGREGAVTGAEPWIHTQEGESGHIEGTPAGSFLQQGSTP